MKEFTRRQTLLWLSILASVLWGLCLFVSQMMLPDGNIAVLSTFMVGLSGGFVGYALAKVHNYKKFVRDMP